jgi:hypothetical protein
MRNRLSWGLLIFYAPYRGSKGVSLHTKSKKLINKKLNLVPIKNKLRVHDNQNVMVKGKTKMK